MCALFSATGIPRHCPVDALDMLEDALHSPKAPARQHCGLPRAGAPRVIYHRCRNVHRWRSPSSSENGPAQAVVCRPTALNMAASPRRLILTVLCTMLPRSVSMPLLLAPRVIADGARNSYESIAPKRLSPAPPVSYRIMTKRVRP